MQRGALDIVNAQACRLHTPPLKCTVGNVVHAITDPLDFILHDETLLRRQATGLRNSNAVRRCYVCATHGSKLTSFPTDGCEFRVTFERSRVEDNWVCKVAKTEHNCDELAVAADGEAGEGGRKKRKIGLTESSLAALVMRSVNPQEPMRRKGQHITTNTMRLPGRITTGRASRAVADARMGAPRKLRQSVPFFGVRNDYANLLKFGSCFSAEDPDNEFHLGKAATTVSPVHAHLCPARLCTAMW